MADGSGLLTGPWHDAAIGVDAASWVGAATRGGAEWVATAAARPPLGPLPANEKAAPREAARVRGLWRYRLCDTPRAVAGKARQAHAAVRNG